MSRWITPLLLGCAWLLSLYSFYQYCTDACSAAAEYRFFGLPLSAVGVGVFTALGIALFTRWRKWLLPTLLVGSGMELYLLYLQKWVIGEWCPVCVGVGVCLLAATAWEWKLDEKRMTILQRTILTVLFAAIGLLIGFSGVEKLKAEPDESSWADRLALGNQDSTIEIYIFTDWFCPACHKVTPTLEELLPEIYPQARVIFAEKVIHKESHNYVPYNLAFLLHDKPRYMKARAMLLRLTDETRRPSQELIKQESQALGTTFRPVSYLEVAQALIWFQKKNSEFGVRVTPTIVVVNRETGEFQNLVGNKAIKAGLMNAIRNLQN